MPRNMSFALTTEQFMNRTKDVTRRLGWDFLQSGDLLWGVKKAMGLKKGEKIERLGMIEVVSATAEPLEAITQEDVEREGFFDWTPEKFVEFFCAHNDIEPTTIVNRIGFRYIGVLLTQELIDNESDCTWDGLKGCIPGDLAFWTDDLSTGCIPAGGFLVGESCLADWVRLCPDPYLVPVYQKAINYIRSTKGRKPRSSGN